MAPQPAILLRMNISLTCFSLFACLGAIITLSGFLTSTMTQQAIEIRVQSIESTNGTASVARATSFSLYDGADLVLGKQSLAWFRAVILRSC